MSSADLSFQDLALQKRLSGDIYERSPFHRGRLDRAELGRHGIKTRVDLPRLPPMLLEDVMSPAMLLLEGRSHLGRRSLVERYWPVAWTNGTIPIAYSADDLDLLAELGERLLTAAGVGKGDMVVDVLPVGSRDHLQLSSGARKATCSTFSLGEGASVRQVDLLRPTVLCGDAREIARLINEAEDNELSRLHTLIVVGESLSEEVYSLLDQQIAVIEAWAPEGVFALWGRCRGGAGMHTWPHVEVVEIVDPLSGLASPPGVEGHLVWTGTGWRATAMVRLQTNEPVVLAGADTAAPANDQLTKSVEPCPACGRRSPRLERVAEAPGFPEVLDLEQHVVGWAAELREAEVGKGDELVIRVAVDDPSATLELLQHVARNIGPAHLMVVDLAEIDRRLDESMGDRFVDRRAF